MLETLEERVVDIDLGSVSLTQEEVATPNIMTQQDQQRF